MDEDAEIRAYENGMCDDCMCCTRAQCSPGGREDCPTNSIGESVCPCTCD